jgi:hypothetical protein
MDFFVVFERFQMGHHFGRPRQLDGQAFFEHDRDARATLGDRACARRAGYGSDRSGPAYS